jgi:hypothetical protein
MVAKSCTTERMVETPKISKKNGINNLSTGAGFRNHPQYHFRNPQDDLLPLQISPDLLIAMHHSHEFVCAGLRSDIEEGAVDAGDPFDQRGFTCHLKDDLASQFNSFFFSP